MFFWEIVKTKEPMEWPGTLAVAHSSLKRRAGKLCFAISILIEINGLRSPHAYVMLPRPLRVTGYNNEGQ